MTREEAIKVLKKISATLKSWDGFTEYPQAIDMAMEALQATEHDGCEGCKYTGKDLYELPCLMCKQSQKDLWERREP